MTAAEFDEMVDMLMDLHRPDRYTLDANGWSPWMTEVDEALQRIAAENPGFAAHLSEPNR
ncbi:MAG: hypothetical protein H0U29_12995 [Acidimicrobiia bacterium]|nr:hypothetical protein [Acidimicrobiia bacterium]